MKGEVPTIPVALFQRQPRVVYPLLIKIRVVAIRRGDLRDLRDGLGQRAKLGFALFQLLLHALARAYVASEGLPASVGQNARADFDGRDAAVFSPEHALGLMDPSQRARKVGE